MPVVQSFRPVQKKGAANRKEALLPQGEHAHQMHLVCQNWGVAPSLPLHAHYLSDVCQSPAVTVGGREIKQLDVRQRHICAWHEVKEGW